jgi:hypothetical protein
MTSNGRCATYKAQHYMASHGVALRTLTTTKNNYKQNSKLRHVALHDVLDRRLFDNRVARVTLLVNAMSEAHDFLLKQDEKE